MSDDDLERRLERMYRSLDESADRVQAGWRARSATRRTSKASTGSIAAWIGAGVAAAAAILLMVLALRSEQKPVVEVVQAPIPAPEPQPRRVPPQTPLPAPPPRPSELLPQAPAQSPTPTPSTPVPPPGEAPKPPSPSVPSPSPSTPVPEPSTPTVVAKASAVLRETDGTFELADRSVRGKQRELTVSAGDRLRATSLVKLSLAEDRFVLLAPKTVVEFRPEEKRLALSLELGEALADLVSPGPDVHIVTKACDVAPLGTVFAVKVVPGRSIVTVEKGRVEIRSSKGKATLRAAESVQAGEDGTLGATVPADFRTLAWARGHRAPELTLYAEDFSKQGAWEGEIDKGVARTIAKPGSSPMLHLATEKPMFEVPVRGALTVVCRADRASRLKVQIFAGDVRTTYRLDVPVLRSSDWRILNFSFDDFVPSDRTKASGRPQPGAPVTDLILMYGDEEERGSLWVDSIKVTELRP